MKITWPIALMVMWVTTLIMGSSLALVLAGKVEPSFLVIPLGAVLGAASTAAIALGAYAKGKAEMPDMPDGTELRLVSTRLPPSVEDLLGNGVSLPRQQEVPDLTGGHDESEPSTLSASPRGRRMKGQQNRE